MQIKEVMLEWDKEVMLERDKVMLERDKVMLERDKVMSVQDKETTPIQDKA